MVIAPTLKTLWEWREIILQYTCGLLQSQHLKMLSLFVLDFLFLSVSLSHCCNVTFCGAHTCMFDCTWMLGRSSTCTDDILLFFLHACSTEP